VNQRTVEYAVLKYDEQVKSNVEGYDDKVSKRDSSCVGVVDR